MKKLFLLFCFMVASLISMNAQFTTNQWYSTYWGSPSPPNVNDLTSVLYRQGSTVMRDPYPWTGEGIKGKGFLFFNQDSHWEWNNPNYGLSLADFSRVNLSMFDSYNWNNNATQISGYGGVAITSQAGAMFMHQNGIVSIGLNALWKYSAKIRTLSLKTVDATSADAAYLLYVRGGIVSEKVKVALVDNWPDYVFKKDYALLPLSKVEEYIKEKGYLPKTKSAAVIEKEGLELGETAKAQQEKIEELFLHLIDMDKRLKALEAENAELKTELNHIKK